MRKQKISIQVNLLREQIEWLENRKLDGTFASLSEGVRTAMVKLMKAEKEE